ncbi:hypothetical protein D9M68_944640 [compost metagenome]
MGRNKFTRLRVSERDESDAGAQGRRANMLLHGLLCRPSGMPAQRLEYLAMFLPGLHRTLGPNERQLLTLQENIRTGGNDAQHRLVAAGLQDTPVKLEIQA